MKVEVIGKCPVCNNELMVTKLQCNKCKTTIEGEFNLCKFSKLSNEEKYFLEVFIKNRGNIREVEKELNISYPTVKNRLEDLIASLGYSPNYREAEINKKDILDKLSEGEINSDEALGLLKG